ncbi:hypothetical protein A2U01_0100529 [Trifolium medium]|uniref:Uncharacterized protein n=1 Tax=Trifolium medium TaxID=97028 RepID=A0A392UT97_9FABA|nr:hypothetical protein [Trifolium medium]
MKLYYSSAPHGSRSTGDGAGTFVLENPSGGKCMSESGYVGGKKIQHDA